MSQKRLIDVTLDASTLTRWSAEVEHERRVAVFDLLEENSFELLKSANEDYEGPFKLHLSTMDGRLVFEVKSTGDDALMTFQLALSPLRRIIREYFAICDSYYEAIRSSTPSQIEAIDMGRRGLHNEGSELLRERLDGKVAIDHQTSRRLFTLICALHLKAGQQVR